MRKEKYVIERKTKTHHYLQISIDYKDREGRRQTWSKNLNVADYETPTDAMDEAVLIRDRKLAELRSGRPIKHVPTVGDLFQRTQILFVASIKTWKRHCIAYNHSIKQYAAKPITEVKAADIQQSLNDSIKSYSADATGRVLAVWRQIYRAAIMDGIVVADQTQVVHMPRDRKPIQPKKEVMISQEDFNSYIEWLTISKAYTRDAKGKYRKARIIYILQIMYHTGMRPAEVLALSRSDFDISGRVIHVTKQVGSTATELRHIVAPKTDSSVRDVPISDALLPIVTDMLIKLPGDHPLYDIDGLPFDISYLSAFISRTSKQIGIDFNMYMCRHSLKRSMREAGVDPRIQQDILGHASYKTSIGYDRSTEKEREEALNHLPA